LYRTSGGLLRSTRHALFGTTPSLKTAGTPLGAIGRSDSWPALWSLAMDVFGTRAAARGYGGSQAQYQMKRNVPALTRHIRYLLEEASDPTLP